jgi:hypothetical protein
MGVSSLAIHRARNGVRRSLDPRQARWRSLLRVPRDGSTPAAARLALSLIASKRLLTWRMLAQDRNLCQHFFGQSQARAESAYQSPFASDFPKALATRDAPANRTGIGIS